MAFMTACTTAGRCFVRANLAVEHRMHVACRIITMGARAATRMNIAEYQSRGQKADTQEGTRNPTEIYYLLPLVTINH